MTLEVNKWSGMKVNLKKKIVSNDISDFILIVIRFVWYNIGLTMNTMAYYLFVDFVSMLILFTSL